MGPDFNLDSMPPYVSYNPSLLDSHSDTNLLFDIGLAISPPYDGRSWQQNLIRNLVEAAEDSHLSAMPQMKDIRTDHILAMQVGSGV